MSKKEKNESLPVILTIEDDESVRLSIVAYLEDCNFRIIEAENGQEGVEIFRQKMPDLVLVDLRLPVMDGLEVLSCLASEFPDIPKIVVSGTGVISDAIEALHRGAWDFVIKPIQDMVILEHAINKSFERVRLINEKRKAEEEKEKIIKKLENSLAHIKTLRGLLPICSYCKNIRDDKGYWQQIEIYITENSEADFSHGICPDCMRKLYPHIKVDKNIGRGDQVTEIRDQRSVNSE
jgi:FixJ family two-component response regulator